MAQESERADGAALENNVVRHVEASKTAIATGGITGTGFLENSITGGGFVPEQQTDFIFTAVAEELGFVGGRRAARPLRVAGAADLAHRRTWPATSSAR